MLKHPLHGIALPPMCALLCGGARAAQANILPFAAVVARIQGAEQGASVGLEFQRDKGKWVCEARLLTPDGKLMEIDLDAWTGAVLSRRMRRKATGN